jgi:hypothetical protein
MLWLLVADAVAGVDDSFFFANKARLGFIVTAAPIAALPRERGFNPVPTLQLSP